MSLTLTGCFFCSKGFSLWSLTFTIPDILQVTSGEQHEDLRLSLYLRSSLYLELHIHVTPEYNKH